MHGRGVPAVPEHHLPDRLHRIRIDWAYKRSRLQTVSPAA